MTNTPEYLGAVDTRFQNGKAAGLRCVWRDIKKYRALLLMLSPAAIFLVFNSYLPMFGVLIAFKDVNYSLGILKSPWAGIENFRYLFATSDAWIMTRNTVLYNLTFMALGLVLTVGVAIALNEIKNHLLKKFYQTVMILPYFLSMVIVSYLAYAFLDTRYGYVNTLLEHIGIGSVSWYSEKRYWPFILTLVNEWKSVGMGSIIYLAAITGIDTVYYEAAVMDGAGKWQQITKITLPMIKRVIVIMTILSMGRIFTSDFGLFYQVPQDSGALYDVTQTIDTYVYRGLMRLNDIGMSSAANFYQSIVGFVLVLLSNLLARKIDEESALL